MWTDSSDAVTAEWECTKCGATNRRLLPPRAVNGKDRCVHCRLRHTISAADTPVRWNAKAA